MKSGVESADLERLINTLKAMPEIRDLESDDLYKCYSTSYYCTSMPLGIF